MMTIKVASCQYLNQIQSIAKRYSKAEAHLPSSRFSPTNLIDPDRQRAQYTLANSRKTDSLTNSLQSSGFAPAKYLQGITGF